MSTTNTTPRGTDWEKDGIGIDDQLGGPYLMIRSKSGTLVSSYTTEHLREILEGHYDTCRKIESLEQEIRYTKPSTFAPSMIAALEEKADECDKQKWFGQAMAYRDAAGLMRKALKKEGT